MSERRACQECGAPLPPRRTKFCSDACRHRDGDKRRARRSPCSRCGGDKGYGVRGGKYCQPCRDDMAPVWKEAERERALLKGRAARRAAGIRQRMPKIREDGHIWCPNCAQYLPPERFPKRAGRAGSCRACTRMYHHEYLLRKYGIDLAEYHRLLASQDGRCAICRSRPNKVRLAVDHDHETGRVRGLLCKRCNKDLLGAGRESPVLLRRAAAYLESPPAVTGATPSEDEESLRWEALLEHAEREDVVLEADGQRIAVKLSHLVSLLRVAGVAIKVGDMIFEPTLATLDDESRVAELKELVGH